MFCVLLAAHETTLSRILHHPSGLEVGAGAHERCHQNRATAILLEKLSGNNHIWDSSATAILLYKPHVVLVVCFRPFESELVCWTFPCSGLIVTQSRATIMPTGLDKRENVNKSSLDPVTRAGNAAHIILSYAANEIAYCYWRTI